MPLHRAQANPRLAARQRDPLKASSRQRPRLASPLNASPGITRLENAKKRNLKSLNDAYGKPSRRKTLSVATTGDQKLSQIR